MQSPNDRVSRHQAVFTKPPAHVPSEMMPDGPLLGNGGVGVVMAGPAEQQWFCIGRNDFWTRTPGDASIIAVGRIGLTIPELKGATYHQEEDLEHAEVRGRFTEGGTTVLTRSWVDANQNLLVTELRSEGQKSVAVSVRQMSGAANSPEPVRAQSVDVEQRICSFDRKADELPGRCREVSVATRVLAPGVTMNHDGEMVFTLRPGETAAVVTSVMSDLDTPDFATATARRVAGLRRSDIARLNKAHRRWWARFWARSFIEIPDQEIESRWYAALYVMGSCSRAGQVAPGLWGNWITTNRPAWHGDFHLNYNFEAPYYIVYSSNHTDLAAPYYQALSDYIPNGRAMAKRHGWTGIHFPVCIGPWGLAPEDPDRDWGQRSDAAYAALNFIWGYQYTQDLGFLRHIAYPYLREVAAFWKDYLRLENGRYVIDNDSIHEGSGPDVNGVLSLGLVHTLFKNMVEMSQDLGVDAGHRAKWRDICDRLSAYPLQIRDGRQVFRYTEKGLAWADGNTLGIQQIFPAGAVGLDSDPKLLDICRNMIDVMARWHDGNGFSSWYTACARVGIDPKLILSKMREECLRCSYPNLVLSYGGGGIENVSGFLAINEMLMQSHEGVIRLFPDWPLDEDARFGSLRAVGAFLVSARLYGGVISDVRIVSEKGRLCPVQNPWPGRAVRLVRSGGHEEVVNGDRFTFKTSPGESLALSPVTR